MEKSSSVPGLRTAMKKAGFTQADFAAKMDVSVVTVSRWVRGEIEPPISTVKDMAALLGSSVQELLGLATNDMSGCKILSVQSVGAKKIITIEIE